jgi:hypothetical protein
MGTIKEIPRNLNKENIDIAINNYQKLLNEIPLSITETTLSELLHKIKRETMGVGPWPNVSFFEASNRIMSDLVILYGIKQILNGEYEELNKYTEFTIELGNENKNNHDVESHSKESILIGEAFNVAPSFFNTKISKTLKKLNSSKIQAIDHVIFCNADSHSKTSFKYSNNIQIIKVDINLYLQPSQIA